MDSKSFLILFVSIILFYCEGRSFESESSGVIHSGFIGESSGRSCILTVTPGLIPWTSLDELEYEYTPTAGGLLVLSCDASCSGWGQTPGLRWRHPNGTDITRLRNRIFSVDFYGRRYMKLYFNPYRPEDAGRYTCRGFIDNKWMTAGVTLGMGTHILGKEGSGRI